MRKIIALCSLSAVFASSVAVAQSPASGHIGASSYINNYLNFSYAWPKALFPSTNPSSISPHRLPAAATSYSSPPVEVISPMASF